MGAWGFGSFENDDTWDWLNEFFDKPSLELVKNALDAVANFDEKEYMELPECGAALGAAEIVAALGGHPHSELPEDVAEWVQANPFPIDNEIKSLALRALARVKGNSEMQDLREDRGNSDEWLSEINALEQRLQ